MGRGSDCRWKPAGVGSAGIHELFERALEWTWGDHRARHTRTLRHRPQHAAHGMGFEDKEEGRGWHRASILARKPLDGATRGSKLTAMETPSVREYATEAIGYWEPPRVIYNLVLVAVVVAYFVAGYPTSKQNLTTDSILVLFLLAGVAHVPFLPGSTVSL